MAFNAILETTNGIAKLKLSGELDANAVAAFKMEIEKVADQQVKKLVLLMQELEYISSAGLRVLIFTKQKIGSGVKLYVVGAPDQVVETLEKTGFHHSVIILSEYNVDEIEISI